MEVLVQNVPAPETVTAAGIGLTVTVTMVELPVADAATQVTLSQ